MRRAPSLDPESLSRLTRVGGPPLLARLIDLFLESAPATARVAAEAFARGDHEAVRDALHPLEGSAGMLGAESLRLRLRELGRESRDRSASDMHLLESELAGVLEELRALRVELPGHPSNL